MDDRKLWKGLTKRGWKLTFATAFMLDTTSSIGLEVMLITAPDKKKVPAHATIVHHEELEREDAVLEAAWGLCVDADPEFG